MLGSFISGSASVWLIAATLPLQLPNSVCGPPREVISAVEARGYVNEPELAIVLPPSVANRSDIAILVYLLGPEEAREKFRATSGYFGQSIVRIVRTDREPGRPGGWACVLNELPILDAERRAMLDRAKRVDKLIK